MGLSEWIDGKARGTLRLVDRLDGWLRFFLTYEPICPGCRAPITHETIRCDRCGFQIRETEASPRSPQYYPEEHFTLHRNGQVTDAEGDLVRMIYSVPVEDLDFVSFLIELRREESGNMDSLRQHAMNLMLAGFRCKRCFRFWGYWAVPLSSLRRDVVGQVVGHCPKCSGQVEILVLLTCRRTPG